MTEQEQPSINEQRVRALTKLYYSKPEVQQALLAFAAQREVVPRFYEGFGKRPDTITYPSDIMSLVNRGATSFHGSQELWRDPLQIRTEMSSEELGELRSAWDLLIDIDSKFLDCSKVAATLIIAVLEKYGVKSYGIKFSGSKGFHIIVPALAFPLEFKGVETRSMFPEWPRAISEFLMKEIKQEYNKIVSTWDINFDVLQERINVSREDITEIPCPNPQCGQRAKKSNLVVLQCNRCNNITERPNFKITKRKMRCIVPTCPGEYEVKEEKEYYLCESCKYDSRNYRTESTSGKVTYSSVVRKHEEKFSSDFKEEISASALGSLDLVLVSSRHLFRMPYSLHEKTALASIVLSKEEIESFTPNKADPLKVQIKNYYPLSKLGEATRLLEAALIWKESHEEKRNEMEKKKYASVDRLSITGVTEDMFPAPIHKLLKGLKEGRKRGLFILLTFLRALNFNSEYIHKTITEWNKRNVPPLKEGYVRSQIDWHLRQKRQILPPNYANESFYKDLNLLDKQPTAKNPIVDVLRALKKQSSGA